MHRDYAFSLNSLAVLYCSMGEYAKAEPLYLQARDIRKKVLGEQHPNYATSLHNLAGLYHEMGEYAKAEPLLPPGPRHLQEGAGEQHPEYAASLNNLALLYQSMGEYAKAEPLLLQARDIRKKVLGEQHPDYAGSLSNVADLYYLMAEYAKAADLNQQEAKIQYDLAVTILAAVSEAQALNYAAKELGLPSMLISAWRHTTRPDDDLYACVWMRRGLIQQITAKRQQRLHEIGGSEVRQRYQHYQDTRRGLAQLILAPADPDPKRLAAKRKRSRSSMRRRNGWNGS